MGYLHHTAIPRGASHHHLPGLLQYNNNNNSDIMMAPFSFSFFSCYELYPGGYWAKVYAGDLACGQEALCGVPTHTRSGSHSPPLVRKSKRERERESTKLRVRMDVHLSLSRVVGTVLHQKTYDGYKQPSGLQQSTTTIVHVSGRSLGAGGKN